MANLLSTASAGIVCPTDQQQIVIQRMEALETAMMAEPQMLSSCLTQLGLPYTFMEYLWRNLS